MKDSLGLMNFHETMKMLKISEFQNTKTTQNTAKLKIGKYMFMSIIQLQLNRNQFLK